MLLLLSQLLLLSHHLYRTIEGSRAVVRSIIMICIDVERGQDCSKLNICKYLVNLSASSDPSVPVANGSTVTKLKTDRAIYQLFPPDKSCIFHFTSPRIEMIDDNLIAGSRPT